jgi:uncharacterized integral membrane protein
MTGKQLKILGVTVAVVLATIVVLQNTDTVATQILFFKVEMPQAVLLFVHLALGFAIGLLFSTRVMRARPPSRPAGPPAKA